MKSKKMITGLGVIFTIVAFFIIKSILNVYTYDSFDKKYSTQEQAKTIKDYYFNHSRGKATTFAQAFGTFAEESYKQPLTVVAVFPSEIDENENKDKIEKDVTKWAINKLKDKDNKNKLLVVMYHEYNRREPYYDFIKRAGLPIKQSSYLGGLVETENKNDKIATTRAIIINSHDYRTEGDDIEDRMNLDGFRSNTDFIFGDSYGKVYNGKIVDLSKENGIENLNSITDEYLNSTDTNTYDAYGRVSTPGKVRKKY